MKSAVEPCNDDDSVTGDLSVRLYVLFDFVLLS
jgi:DNA-binding MltR family transcriptional regulator